MMRFEPRLHIDAETAGLIESTFVPFAHAAATIETDAGAIGLGLMQNLMPRQVIGQWLALRPGSVGDGAGWFILIRAGNVLSLAGLQLLQLQLQLLNLASDPL
jgi:hypothetical protein